MSGWRGRIEDGEWGAPCMKQAGVLEAVVAAGLWGRAVKKGRFSYNRLHGLSAPYPRRCLEDNQTLCISAVMRFAYRKC